MSKFLIEWEVPPLRAIYTCEVEADTETQAVEIFLKERGSWACIRKIDGRRIEKEDAASMGTSPSARLESGGNRADPPES